MSGYFRYHGTVTVDDFVFTTNFYPGLDVPLAEISQTLSTGGIQMNLSNFFGDFHSVNDSLTIQLENSDLGKNLERNKLGHGLACYGQFSEVQLNNSTIEHHGIDGIHLRTSQSDALVENSIINSNFSNGFEVIGSLNLISDSFLIGDNGSNGIDVSQTFDWQSDFDLVADNGDNGVTVGSTFTLVADSLEVVGNFSNGIVASGSNSDVTLYQCNLHQY